MAAGNYSVTVTDNTGCTATGSATITEPTAQTITLTSPNGGESWTVSSSHSITWTSTGGISIVNLWYSTNGGSSWNFIDSVSNTGTFNWVIPNSPSTQCLVKVSNSANGSINDVSDAAFTIASACNLTVSITTGTGTATAVPSGGTPPYSYMWYGFAGAFVDSTATINVTAGPYSVDVTDAIGCTASNSITISTCNASTALPYSQTFEDSAFAPVNWLVGNPNSDITWTRTTAAGGFGASPASAKMENYSNSTIGAIDELFSPIFNFSADSFPWLKFDVAYARYSSADFDNLKVFISSNCNTWTQIYSKSSTTLATAPDDTMPFVPQSSQWRKDSVNLAPYGGQSTVQIKFQNISGWGNNLYLDNIFVYNQTVCNISINSPSKTDVTCNGGSDGTISMSNISGGTTPFTFLWSNGATGSPYLNGIPAGTYSLTITDANSCTGTSSISVSQPAAISVTISKTDASCFGCSDGSATATASGGSAPYTYLWSNSATTATITGLSAGSYSLTVTDASGCTNSDSLTITQPTGTAPTASFTNSSTNLCPGTPVSFTDQSTGTPTSWSWTFSGGTPSTSTQQNPSVTYSSSGTYSVMLIVSNAFGSDTATANLNVTLSAGPSASTSSTNASCFGCANGTASVIASGGTSPYTYLWSNAASSASLSGLIAGTYSVTVTDATGCTANSSVTISEPAALSVTVAGNNPTCSNGNNGNALASVSGGTSPYTYQWSNGKITSLIGNLQAGTYTVTVTDFSGSTATGSITLTAPAAINLSLTALDASCGTANGLASVSASGGSTPYTYLWSNGQTSSIASNLTAGMYTVTVTASNGCKAVGSTTVNTSSGFAVSFSGTNISCNGSGNGIATATATGGSTPYSYQWSNGGTSSSVTGLGAGNYSATVTDNSGCSMPGTVNISQPSSMVLSLNGTNVTACGNSNGAINLTATGGTAPYTYLWSNSSTTEDQAGLATGTYTVTVTDANGCTKTKSLAITAPSAATLTLNSNNVSCNGSCDGIAIAMASGGNSPYTYAWSNGKTGTSVTGMCAGTYNVTATESTGCSVTGSVTVTEPTALVITASATAATCGVSNGTLSSSATGGTTPYSYQWSSGDTTVTADSLASGIYLVTVTDANGCSNFGMATISNGGAPTLTVNSVTHVLCNGAGNGAIDITASGAATPFTYAWSNGSATQDISNLSAGPYEVTVTNTNNCVSVQSINVSEPEALVLSVTSNNASCGNADGTAMVAVTGGTTPYTYSWSNSGTTAQISNLSAQIYSVTVTDSKSCIKTIAVPIGETGGPEVTLDSVVSAGCNGTGSVFVSVSEGVPPYTFSWDNGSVNEDLLGVSSGTYGLIVSDINGCSGALSAGIAAQQITTDPICLMTVDTATGTNRIVWEKTFGSGISAYKIYRETTQSGVFQAVGTVPFDSLSVFTDPVANPLIHSWRYKISAIDSCGNESPKSNEHKTMHVTISLGLGGTINLIWDHYQGFAYPTYYIYRFKPQTGWTLIDSLASNTTSYTDYFPPTLYGLQYFVEARHPDGCFATKVVENHNSSRSNRSSAAMPAPSDLLADTLVTDATQGNCDGEATVIASGGITPYAYVWNTTPIQTTATATGLCAGDYQVTVTDSEGDMALVDVTVSTIIGVESKTEGALSLRIYPNPVREEMNLVVNTSSSQKMNIVLVNTLGQEDVIYSGRMEKGETNLKFDTGILSAGVYYLKIVAGEGKPEYMRFVKGR